MQQWDLTYGSTSKRWDVALFVMALGLHAPLLFFRLEAPQKGRTKSLDRLVNIDFIEERIRKQKEQPVILPPKLPTTSKELMKKVEEVKNILKPLPPPPPPKPKAMTELLKGPDPAALKPQILNTKIDAQKNVLQSKGTFQDKTLKIDSNNNPSLKVGGNAGTIAASSKFSGVDVPQGGTVKGKSGFQMSKDAMPMSIGDDDGGIKVGGESQIVTVPMGSRAKGDASILSPVVRDRGSLKSAGPAGLSGGSGSGIGGSTELGGVGGGATAIQVASARGSYEGVPGGGGAPAIKSEKKFDAKSYGSGGSGSQGSTSLGTPVAARPLPAPRVTKAPKPMFVITGPLANRQVIKRDVPSYPEWARARAIEAAVILQFTVNTEGNVKNNVLVLRTSGFPQMDDLAVSSLKRWKFAPLPDGQYRDEVGNITFNFAVR